MQQKIIRFLRLVSVTAIIVIGFASWRKSTEVQRERARSKPPNIVLLIADDLGYSDLSLYGGEVSTPNIEALANRGMMFTKFYAGATCSPSRSMLISGIDNHQAGLGSMGEYLSPNQVGKPGYEGFLNNRVVSLATLLKDGGYHTYMVGKWHLGAKSGYLPSDRGFEQSFALLQGAANHYNQMGYNPARPKADYINNGEAVNLPANFYSTDVYTDRLIEYIDRDRSSSKPFFIYAAFTSPHDPLQASQADIKKFLGKYDMGWDKLRQQRFDRMKKLGIIPANIELPPRWSRVPVWDSLTPEQKRYESKKMAIYSAMIKNLDDNIGRLIDHLKKIGEYDNTIFIFLSDNGAEGNNRLESQKYQTWFKKEGIDNSYQNIGNANSFVGLNRAWAQVGSTPFLWYKGRVSEGGIRVPAIFSYAGVIKAGNKTAAFASVMDVMPTLLEYAGVKHPGTSYKGNQILPMQGRSLRSLLEGKRDRIYNENDGIGFELFGSGNSALFQGDWKILKLSPPWGDGQWKLFNLREDPRELVDLSKQHPERLVKMISLYEKYAQEKGVISASKELYDVD